MEDIALREKSQMWWSLVCTEWWHRIGKREQRRIRSMLFPEESDWRRNMSEEDVRELEAKDQEIMEKLKIKPDKAGAIADRFLQFLGGRS